MADHQAGADAQSASGMRIVLSLFLDYPTFEAGLAREKREKAQALRFI
jgi:hypothetical protein